MLPATHVADTGWRCIFSILTSEKTLPKQSIRSNVGLVLKSERSSGTVSFNTSFLLLFIAFTGTHCVLTFVLLQRNAQQCID